MADSKIIGEIYLDERGGFGWVDLCPSENDGFLAEGLPERHQRFRGELDAFLNRRGVLESDKKVHVADVRMNRDPGDARPAA
jgi:hypothetical protein